MTNNSDESGSEHTSFINEKLLESAFSGATKQDISTLGDVLSPNEVKRILKYTLSLALKGGKYLRDAILLRLYALTGRRRNEILALTVGDIDFENNLIKTHIQKKKQTGHSRFISIDKTTIVMLKEYISQVVKSKVASKRLFNVSERYPLRVIKRMAQELGINKRVTTHSFRYSLITALKIKGFTNSTIAKITGQNPLTVARYDMSTFFDVKDSFEKIRQELYGLDDDIE